MNYDFDVSMLNIADDFYNAYLRCREGKNPQKLSNGSTKFECVNIPAIVNGSFAIEVYLKYLILQKQKRDFDKHDIKWLFFKLSKDDKKILKSRISSKLNKFLTFDDSLKIIDKSFIDWRYVYERGDFDFGLNSTLTTIDIFLTEIRKYCLERTLN